MQSPDFSDLSVKYPVHSAVQLPSCVSTLVVLCLGHAPPLRSNFALLRLAVNLNARIMCESHEAAHLTMYCCRLPPSCTRILYHSFPQEAIRLRVRNRVKPEPISLVLRPAVLRRSVGRGA